jgi:hypothetical protein
MLPRRLSLPALLALAFLAGSGPGAAADRADFSGSWVLNEKLSTKVSDLLAKDGFVPPTQDPEAAAAAASRSRRGGGVPPGGGLSDSATTLLEEAQMIAITDEGDIVRIGRMRGKKRTLFPDGEEREIDDGEGPAATKAKRKGSRGERIVVFSEWAGGRKMDETWELQEKPRRLVVTTKISGRRSFTVKRVYDPEPETPAAAATAVPTPVPAPKAAPASPAVPPAGMASCSVKPPRGASAAELSRLATVSQAEAQRKAAAFVAPRRAASVVSSDVEAYEGCLVWSFILRFSDSREAQEITVDAGDGRILASVVEPGSPDEKPR